MDLENSMEIVGICWSVSATTGKKVYTLCVKESFSDYYADSTKGRGCTGMAVESIYVGGFDCSDLDVGDHIEILYGRAISGKDGKTFQPIKRIEKLD